MPAAQAQVGNTKLFINCFRNPTSISVTENLRELKGRTLEFFCNVQNFCNVQKFYK